MLFNADLLKLVREQKGYTQTGFAAALGIKQTFVSKFERGTAIPSGDMVEKIAQLTQYPVSFFEQEDSTVISGLVFHRKRTLLSAAKRDTIEAEGKLRAMEAKSICEKLGKGSNVLPRDDRSPEDMAQLMRKHWKVAPLPIENLVKLLEDNGIVILKFDFGTDLLDGF